jgi:PAS domain S-box-containing protein
MQLRNQSLSNRLWLILLIAILPLFALTSYDYQQARQAALQSIERDARLLLSGALIAEDEALRQAEITLRTMALANDMSTLDAKECSGLANRLKSVRTDLANLGAANPDGMVFCSALPLSNKLVDVRDRTWFRESASASGISQGQFLIGRISGKPSVTFSYPMRDEKDRLRAVLFASTGNHWFDRFTTISTLPDGWTSQLMTRDGKVISRYPEPEKWRDKLFPEESRKRLADALNSGKSGVTMIGLDGINRRFEFKTLKIGGGQLIASVGVPAEASLAAIENAFLWRLAMLFGVALLSVLFARYMLREVVDRKFAETLDELTRLKVALDHVPAYVYIKDREGRYRYANARTLSMFGVSPEALKEHGDESFFPAATAARIRAIDAQVLAGHDTDEILDINEPGSGRVVYHEIKAAISDGPGKAVWGLCGISTDVTKFYQAEETVRKLSLVIEQSPESIVFADINGTIEYVNAAFEKVTGYSREEVIGQNPRLLQSGLTPPERYRELWATLTAGLPWQGEFVNKRKDGSQYLELARMSPIRQADGKITHYVAVKTDITEQRRNEAELADYRAGLERLVDERTTELAVAKESAEAANLAKSAFLANMSHEIRTPINAIIGLNHLLLQSELSPEQATKVHKVSHAANHLLQVINDILDLSKIEAGKLQLESAPFSPGDVIRTIAGMIHDRAAGKGLKVDIDTDQLPEGLIGDEMRLRQILLNFASNALKFTEQGGIVITGRVEGEEGEAICCRFSVSDTGIGIHPEEMARLFLPFEQLDSSTTRRHGGTGLGLAIAHHLCELMGGKAGVDSQPGQGSTFWISIPMRQTAGVIAAPDSEAVPDVQLSGRVLLVEDEPINREIGCELLELIGLTVVSAENGALAVDRIKAEKFDLVLMDVQMPVLDGLAATRQIRALPDHATLPIIALTANAFAEDRIRCLKAGMNDFLTKPVEPERLYKLLADYLKPAAATARQRPAPAVRTPSFDNRALANALTEIRAQLTTGNSQALHHYADIHASIRQVFPEEAGALEQRLARYDFEAALPLVDSLIASLQRADN